MHPGMAWSLCYKTRSHLSRHAAVHKIAKYAI